MPDFKIGDKVFSPSWEYRNSYTDIPLVIVDIRASDGCLLVKDEWETSYIASPDEVKGFPILRPGDVGIIHNPVHNNGLPYWNNRMNEYDGKEVVVSRVYETLKNSTRFDIFGCDKYCFTPAWFELLKKSGETEPSFDTEIEIGDFLG